MWPLFYRPDPGVHRPVGKYLKIPTIVLIAQGQFCVIQKVNGWSKVIQYNSLLYKKSLKLANMFLPGHLLFSNDVGL